jgi:hypothetical protein
MRAMLGNLPPDQGRAQGLYDEQLQRQQQEKLVVRTGRREADQEDRPLFFSSAGRRPA